MTEYGIFFPEGCLERQLWTKEDAEAALRRWRDDEDETDAFVDELCQEHGDVTVEQPSGDCEVCESACADCGTDDDGTWPIGSDVCTRCWDEAEAAS